MEITVAIALGLKLIEAAQKAIAAGQDVVSEEDVDAAIAAIGPSDTALTDAIARARAREAGP